MHIPNSGRGLRSALTILLCALFFLLAMGLTLLSSNVYRSVAAASDATYTHRTALSYLVNQIRRSDLDGGVALGHFGGSDALYLREDGYVTILYCYDGQLRELYTEEGLEFAPGDGVAILPLEELSIQAQDGLISLTVQEGEASHTASLAPHCGLTEEVAP